MNYPRDLPVHACWTLFDRSQGETAAPRDLAWAAWQVLGYALGQPDAEALEEPKNLFAYALANGILPPAGDATHLKPVPWRRIAKETLSVLRGIVE